MYMEIHLVARCTVVRRSAPSTSLGTILGTGALRATMRSASRAPVRPAALRPAREALSCLGLRAGTAESGVDWRIRRCLPWQAHPACLAGRLHPAREWRVERGGAASTCTACERTTIRAARESESTPVPGNAFAVGPGRDAWVAGDQTLRRNRIHARWIVYR